MCRGYYTRTVLAAWNWRDGALSHVWTFDSDDGTPGNRAYRGQGNHNLARRRRRRRRQGRDRLRRLRDRRRRQGPLLDRPGPRRRDPPLRHRPRPARAWKSSTSTSSPRHPNGAEFRDARTGALIWGKPSPDVGRGVAIDIDPRHRGYEMWASGQGLTGLWNVKGEQISDRKPRSCNFGVWWDGDLLREILDGNRISKWDWQDGTRDRASSPPTGCASNNSHEVDPLPLRRHPRRLARGGHLEDDRRQGAADLHDDDPDRAPPATP